MSELKVPFVDLQQRYQEEKKELLSCVEKVLGNDYIKLFGCYNYGLGNILGSQAHVNNFYHRVGTV